MSTRLEKLENSKPPVNMGPPPTHFDDEMRERVVSYVQMGMKAVDIARQMNVSFNTLAKHCHRELEFGLKERHGMVVGALMSKIRQGDTASILFYLKTQLGWKETQVQEIVIPQMQIMRSSEVQQIEALEVIENEVTNNSN